MTFKQILYLKQMHKRNNAYNNIGQEYLENMMFSTSCSILFLYEKMLVRGNREKMLDSKEWEIGLYINSLEKDFPVTPVKTNFREVF